MSMIRRGICVIHATKCEKSLNQSLEGIEIVTADLMPEMSAG